MKREAQVQQRPCWRLDLFAWLERETAVALHYTYPTDGETQATQLVQSLFDER